MNNFLLKITLSVIVNILLIFKKIGDAVIFLGKFFILIIFITYKIIINVFCVLKKIVITSAISPFKLIKITLSRCKTFKSQIPKEKIIFKRKTRVFPIRLPKLPKLKLPKLKTPNFWQKTFLNTYWEIFFIKAKFFFLGASIIAITAVIYQTNILLSSLPNPNYLSLRDIPATTKIYDRNGKLLYEIYAEENRTPVKLNDIPDVLKKATIVIEDKEFFIHKGYSLKGIIRAFIHNLQSNSLEGGSTITQQLVRSVFLTPERTLTRKIKEIILSIWTEKLYTKDQILEMYLNEVPYGGTAWGVEAAAQTYFGKSVKNLTLAEAALLAGLPASPSNFSPYGSHPELALKRQKEVLKKMLNSHFINLQQYEEAVNQKLEFKPPKTSILAPHFVMYVKELLENQYGPRIVEKGGLRVITTLDLNIQEMAQQAVSSHIEELKNLNVGNGAALITDPKNGQILAMVGSADYFDQERGGNVNVVLSLRQPGSSIKVVNYAAALKNGFTAASILDDSPVIYHIKGAVPYKPVNYDGRYHGKIPLRTALASSYNIPAVKVLAKIGVKTMIDQGKLMGISSWNDEDRFGLSLTLGGGEVTMLDMAKVYGTLANNGVRKNLTPFIKIANWKGEEIPLPSLTNGIQAVSPEIAFILTNILSDNSARAPAFGNNSALIVPGKTVAVKTGTSDNKRDNWTIGYTPDYVAIVWVGNNDNSPMNPLLTSGITGAAPIWQEIMINLLKNKEDKSFIKPENVISIPCYGRKEYFIKGTEPKSGCALLTTHTPKPS